MDETSCLAHTLEFFFQKNAVSATDSHTSVVAQSQLELPTTRGASASVSHERAVTPTALRKAPPAALSAGSGLQGIPEDVQHQPDPHAATTFDMDTMGRRSSSKRTGNATQWQLIFFSFRLLFFVVVLGLFFVVVFVVVICFVWSV